MDPRVDAAETLDRALRDVLERFAIGDVRDDGERFAIGDVRDDGERLSA